ncbi:MAG: hypothetical protein QM607_08825 [Microbacterium sp.]
MVVGAIGLPIAFVLTFAVPHGLAPVGATVWALVFFAAAVVFFSLFQVPAVLMALGLTRRVPSPDAAWRLLKLAGASEVRADSPMAPMMVLIEQLPAPVAEALLTEVLARLFDPR